MLGASLQTLLVRTLSETITFMICLSLEIRVIKRIPRSSDMIYRSPNTNIQILRILVGLLILLSKYPLPITSTHLRCHYLIPIRLTSLSLSLNHPHITYRTYAPIHHHYQQHYLPEHYPPSIFAPRISR